MMRRWTWFGWTMAVVGIMLFLPYGVFAQEEDVAPLEVPPGGFVHTVAQGDTLWDLSAKHLGSPWRWNEIWELNRFLTNPHYIYPGIKIVIVPSGPKEAELYLDSSAKQEPVSSLPSPSVSKESSKEDHLAYLDITPVQMICAGQFLKEKPVGIGTIEGGKEPKEGFSTGDALFLSLDQKIPEGQLLAVYRVRGPLRTPGGKAGSGYVKYLIGIIQVTPAENGRLIAKVKESFEDITRNDIVSNEIPAFSRIKIAPVNDGVRSTVIASQLVNEELAAGDFIFIDSGSASGIGAGNVFRIYRAMEFEAGAGTVSRSETMIEVARAVAVRVDENFSTLYVNKSEKSFDVGSQSRRGVSAE